MLMGKANKLYLADTALTVATAAELEGKTLTEVTIVKDVDVTLEKTEVDTSNRANNGWKTFRGGMRESTIEGEMTWDPTDTSFQALRDSYLNGTEIGLAALDGDATTTGSQGPAGNWEIFSFTKSEPLDGESTAKFKARPTSYTFWYERT